MRAFVTGASILVCAGRGREQASSVRQVLRMLPQRQHDVFMLRLDGLSPQEIGQRLGMTANNARVTQHAARSKAASPRPSA